MKKRRDLISIKELVVIAKATNTEKAVIRDAISLLRTTIQTEAADGKSVMTGRSYVVFVMSSLYIASRGTLSERPMSDYIAATRKLTDNRQTLTIREMNRAVVAQKALLGINAMPKATIESYIDVVSKRASLSDDIRTRAHELATIYKDVPAIRKRHTRAIAAGMVYLASEGLGGGVTQPGIARTAGTCETTVRLVVRDARRVGQKKIVRFTVRRLK